MKQFIIHIKHPFLHISVHFYDSTSNKKSKPLNHRTSPHAQLLGHRKQGFAFPCAERVTRWGHEPARRTRLIGTKRSRTPEQKKTLLGDMVDIIWPKVESGEIRPTIFAKYPIQQAEEAQALMASGKSAGKIVLTVK